MIQQLLTDTILMVRPANFGYNAETAQNNTFQNELDINQAKLKTKVLAEFDNMVSMLRDAGVDVLVVDDTAEPIKPDAIFPNNWFSTHGDRIVTYPMYAHNRRLERRDDVVQQLVKRNDYLATIDISHHELNDEILEGTGSMILDRQHRIAYACISQRTSDKLFMDWCALMDFEPVSFISTDVQNFPIYHTNVMLALGHEFAVVCLDSIKSLTDREKVLDAFARTGKHVIDISLDQVNKFVGNMLQVTNKEGDRFLIMSQTSYEALTTDQLHYLESVTNIIAPNINTIETIGGGSVRCMMAEIF